MIERATGETYPYLFWEADLLLLPDFSEGFVVPGEDTNAFFSAVLPRLGLIDSESRDFRDYWVPRMSRSEYNLIRFEGDRYVRAAKLNVTPEPGTSVRVFMSYRPLEEPVEVRRQKLPEPLPRSGFVLVEWGGAEY